MNREDTVWETAFKQAREAAERAVADCLEAHRKAGTDPEWGLNCGFAWVHMAANQPFVRWLQRQQKALGYKNDSAGNVVRLDGSFPKRDDQERLDKVHSFGRRGVYGGWSFHNPGRYTGQSMDVKLEGARAFALALQKAGVVCHADGRLD